MAAQRKKRTPEQNRAAYLRRVERGRQQGLTPSEAAGKPNRDYAAEYDQRIARELATGKRKTAPAAAPRNRRAPTGARLTGSARYDWPNAADEAERRTLARLRSDRRVFVYVQIATVDPYHPLLEQEDIDLDDLAIDFPAEALEVIRQIGNIEDIQLFPNGGIRAQALRADAAASGGLEPVIIREVTGPAGRYRTGSNPAINPANRKERSPLGPDKRRQGDTEMLTYVLRVVLQWS